MRSGLISHPDKVLFAERGETKGDLAEHYVRVAEPLMCAMRGRPVLLQRFPEGAGGPSFFQKRVPKNIPDWLQTTTVSRSTLTPPPAWTSAPTAKRPANCGRCPPRQASPVIRRPRATVACTCM